MASFDEIGETGFDQLLTRRLTTPGGSVAPSVAPEIFPGITLENDRPEWGYNKGEFRYTKSVNPGAPAANQAIILRNPAGSRIIAVVNRIIASSSAGTLGLYLVPLGNMGAGVAQGGGLPSDGRYTLISGGVYVRQSTCGFFALDAAAPAFARAFLSASTLLDLSIPFIVTPGTDLAIVCNTAVATQNTSWSFTERQAQPGELL